VCFYIYAFSSVVCFFCSWVGFLFFFFFFFHTTGRNYEQPAYARRMRPIAAAMARQHYRCRLLGREHIKEAQVVCRAPSVSTLRCVSAQSELELYMPQRGATRRRPQTAAVGHGYSRGRYGTMIGPHYSQFRLNFSQFTELRDTFNFPSEKRPTSHSSRHGQLRPTSNSACAADSWSERRGQA